MGCTAWVGEGKPTLPLVVAVAVRIRAVSALPALLAIACLALTGCGDPSRPGPVPGSAGWLGLNYNSSAAPGGLRVFASRGLVYDRGGTLEIRAGRTVAGSPDLARGLSRSLAAGMKPDIYINPARGPSGCRADPNGTSKLCLPVSSVDINAYVHAFTASVHSIRHAHPRVTIFEPMNEPWNWPYPPGATSGRQAAAEYAAMLARLLPAVRAAGIPLSEIYVPATGQLADGTSWIPDLYQAQPCLRPGPGTCGPIEGWTVHPYGLPGRSSEGIGSLPGLRAAMLSGQNNIIASEIGFCSVDVNHGAHCDQNLPDIVGSSHQTARWMRDTLRAALAMHRAGWLRALLVWLRAGGGWAMQNGDGSLTPQGAALMSFATAHSSGG